MSTSTTHAQRVAIARRTPEGLLHVGRCGSRTESLGAKVDVRSHSRVSTAATHPACSPRRTGSPMSLDPSPGKPCELTKLRTSQHLVAAAEAATAPALHKSQTGQPLVHRAPGLTARVPPPDLLATRRHTERSHVLARQGPPSFPGDLVCLAPGSGSARRAGRSIPRALSSSLIPSGNGNTRTATMATCYGARRCGHRHVGPRWSASLAT